MKTKHTPEQIQKAREYAAEIEFRIADEALDPGFGFAPHVTESEKRKYADDARAHAEAIVRGEHDNNFTIWQRMNYYLTGKFVPLLPKKTNHG